MGQSAIIAAIEDKDDEALRSAIVAELIPVIASGVDPQTYDPRELGVAGGSVFAVVCWQELLWFRNEDSLADHDEITCIRLADGVAYLTNDVRFPDAVLSRTVATPPLDTDSPPVAFGDCYLVPAGATDDWADHENELALWTARGWRYRPGAYGMLIYVRDPVDLGFVHFNADDEWEDGVGPRNLVDGSVRPSDLLIRSWDFENQTTTAPPASGPAGEQYVIGPGATGAWAGQDKKIAWRPAADAAFRITTPFVGEEGYDKALGKHIRWTAGGIWSPAADACVLIDSKEATGSATLDFTTGFNTDFDSYEFRISALKASTDSVALYMQIGAGAGPTFPTSAYIWLATSQQSGPIGNANDSKIQLTDNDGANGSLGNSVGNTLNGVVRFNKPTSGDAVTFDASITTSRTPGATTLDRITVVGQYALAVLTGVRFKLSRGTIPTGRISLYGYRKS